MQPYEPILSHDPEAPEARGLADLLDSSADYALMRPSLLAALGVTEEDLREWERSSTVPPKIEAIVFDEEDGDFELAPPRGGEIEFILDDPEEEEEEDDDEDSDDSDSEDDDSDDDEDEDESDEDDEEGQDDPDADEDEGFDDEDDGFDSDDPIIEDDDGEGD